MTSQGRRAALGLCAITTLATAGCVASPRYPIEAGEAPGDGGLHLSQRPQYPISATDAQGAPAPAAPAAGPAAPPPPAAEDPDEPPHAPAVSAPVDSTDLSPPPGQPPAATDPPGHASLPRLGFARADYGWRPTLFTGPDAPVSDAPVADAPATASPGLDRIAYRHHRHHQGVKTDEASTGAPDEAKTASPSSTSSGKTATTAAERRRLRREARTAKAEALQAEKTAQADDAPSTRSRHRRRGAKAQDQQAQSQQTQADQAGGAASQIQPAEKTASAGSRHHRRGAKAGDQSAESGAARTDASETGATAKATPKGFTYNIRRGDTLYAIARRFNVDTETLAKLNGLKHTRLQPGETVELPPTLKDRGAREHAVGGALAEAAAEPVGAGARKGRHGGADAGSSDPTSAEPASTNPASTGQTAAAAPEPSRADRRATRRAEREARLKAQHLDRLARIDQAREQRSGRRGRGRSFEQAATSAAPLIHAQGYTPPPTQLSSANLGPSNVAQSDATRSNAARSNAVPTAAGSAFAARSPTSGYPAAPTSAPSFAAGALVERPTPYSGGASGSSSAVTSLLGDAPTANGGYARAPASSGYAPARPGGYAYAPAAPRTTGYATPPSSYGVSPYTGEPAPGQLATLNAPAYRAPVLGRVRPSAPMLSSGVVSNTDVATAGHGRFVWPLHGAILQPFGDRGPGQRNDGMDIAAQPGESVRAAAGGEVVYAGSSIPGFGNLVLVKHPGGWVTAYAHLDRIEVRMRDSVSQGEEIGLAGQTGAVSQPQLHFEVRYAPQATEKARPVDPALVLPGAG